jgi:hypothetical protein
MRTPISTLAAILASACVLAVSSGCAASASPDWDSRFGDSVRVLHAQQALDPQASVRNAQATPRTDGRTVREAGDRHLETYRNPPTPTVINIGVGDH